MRKASWLVLVSLLLADPAAGQRRGRERPREPVELTHFSYEVVKFDAPNLKSAAGEFGIYLPRQYPQDEAGEKSWPLILWLHGLNEDASRFHYEGGAKVLDRLRGEGVIPEVILVAPTAPRRTIYANGEADGDIEAYLLDDLVSHIEQHYRVSSERRGRALMGVSMGGMGALRIALKDPQRFGTVAVHSAAAFPADPAKLGPSEGERVRRTVQWLGLSDILGDPIEPEKWARYIPAAMVGKLSPEDVEELRIYFDAGTADRYGFGPPNEAFHEALEAQEISHTFHLVEGGGHSWGSGSLQKQLVASLQFVGSGFAAEVSPGGE